MTFKDNVLHWNKTTVVHFSIEMEEAIKKGYLKQKGHQEIALFLGLRPFDVYNFIQSKNKEWKNYKVYCGLCNKPLKVHRKCSLCTAYVHDEIEVRMEKAVDWYKMYHLFGEDIICNWCVAGMGRKYYKEKRPFDTVL